MTQQEQLDRKKEIAQWLVARAGSPVSASQFTVMTQVVNLVFAVLWEDADTRELIQLELFQRKEAPAVTLSVVYLPTNNVLRAFSFIRLDHEL